MHPHQSLRSLRTRPERGLRGLRIVRSRVAAGSVATARRRSRKILEQRATVPAMNLEGFRQMLRNAQTRVQQLKESL